MPPQPLMGTLTGPFILSELFACIHHRGCQRYRLRAALGPPFVGTYVYLRLRGSLLDEEFETEVASPGRGSVRVSVRRLSVGRGVWWWGQNRLLFELERFPGPGEDGRDCLFRWYRATVLRRRHRTKIGGSSGGERAPGELWERDDWKGRKISSPLIRHSLEQDENFCCTMSR